MRYPKTVRKPARIAAIGLAVGVIAVIGVSSAIANHRGGHVIETGDTLLGTQVRSDTVPFQDSKHPGWASLEGTDVAVSVPFFPFGQERFIAARFTAESSCFGGTATDWCSVRVVARNEQTGLVTELNPAAGADFQFDSVSETNDRREGHAIERSIILRPGIFAPGNWTVFVQWKTTTTSTQLRLDDWHFAVDTFTH